MITVSQLTVLVWISLIVTAIAPATLLGFFIRDLRNRSVW